MSATNHQNDFFRIVDLNPGTVLNPVTDPRDPRGQCYFGAGDREAGNRHRQCGDELEVAVQGPPVPRRRIST